MYPKFLQKNGLKLSIYVQKGHILHLFDLLQTSISFFAQRGSLKLNMTWRVFVTIEMIKVVCFIIWSKTYGVDVAPRVRRTVLTSEMKETLLAIDASEKGNRGVGVPGVGCDHPILHTLGLKHWAKLGN